MKSKNNIIILTITTVILWIVGFKGTIFVFDNPYFHYNGLPLWSVYCMLALYILIVIAVTVLTITRFAKFAKHNK